jgi:hypothetical protein
MQNRLPSSARSKLPGNKFGEVIEMPRVCSVFDKPYIARYKRRADGSLMLLDVQPVQTVATSGKESAAKITVAHKEIDGSNERCPWCSAKGLGFCESCASWTCSGGLTKQQGGDDFFRCRASCGSKNEIDIVPDTWTVAGREAKDRLPALQKAALPSGREGKPLPAHPKSALPSGKVRGFLKS